MKNVSSFRHISFQFLAGLVSVNEGKGPTHSYMNRVVQLPKLAVPSLLWASAEVHSKERSISKDIKRVHLFSGGFRPKSQGKVWFEPSLLSLFW